MHRVPAFRPAIADLAIEVESASADGRCRWLKPAHEKRGAAVNAALKRRSTARSAP